MRSTPPRAARPVSAAPQFTAPPRRATRLARAGRWRVEPTAGMAAPGARAARARPAEPTAERVVEPGRPATRAWAAATRPLAPVVAARSRSMARPPLRGIDRGIPALGDMP